MQLQPQSHSLSPLPSHLPFELIALEKAIVYQEAVANFVQPFIGKRILEIGSGIGNMSRWFTKADRLILTELDTTLFELLNERKQHWKGNTENISIIQLDAGKQSLERFQTDNIDTIMSFNVLEHIENDADTLHSCATLLRNSQAPGKKRIVSFLPAHQWAYGVMDKAVGHHRRYNKHMIRSLHQAIMPEASLTLIPFNLVGLIGWTINGRILRRKCAGEGMIGMVEKLWPITQKIDHLFIKKLGLPFGQSLLAVHEF